MRVLALLLAASFSLLAGCGTDSAGQDPSDKTRAVLQMLKGGNRPPPGTLVASENDPAVQDSLRALRASLEGGGQPIILASIPSLKYGTFHAPFGRNGDVQTWASPGYQEISLRNGVLIATRGFGPDLMSASAPDIATLQRGSGTVQRQYFYLDGADQRQVFEFTCTISTAGTETITVVAKSHATRKVVEACSGPTGSFTNSYWFENGGYLRQSSQFMAPGVDNLFMQRVVD